MASCRRRRELQRSTPESTLGVVGESGCGKSTTAKLVLGLLPATRGHHRPLPAKTVSARTVIARWRALAPTHADGPSGPARRARPASCPVGEQIVEPLVIHSLERRRLRPGDRRRSPYSKRSACAPRPVPSLSPRTIRRPAPARRARPRPRSSIPSCWSATNRSRHSTSPSPPRSSTCCRTCRAASAWPISSSAMTSKWSGRSPTRSRSCISAGSSSRAGTRGELFHAPGPSLHRGARFGRSRRSSVARASASSCAAIPPNPVDRPTGCAFHPRCPRAIAVLPRPKRRRCVLRGHRPTCRLPSGTGDLFAIRAA
jgi:peptide/nickel transport system ATP-binding protein